jgi:hypothetical protein
MAQRITALRGVLGLCTTGTIIASNHAEADSDVSFERRQLSLFDGIHAEKEDGYEVVNAATAKVETPSGAHLCDRNDGSQVAGEISPSPFRREEIDAALDNIARRPELFSSMLPPRFSEMPKAAVTELFNRTKVAVSDPELVASTLAQLKCGGTFDREVDEKSSMASNEADAAAVHNTSPSLLWDELVTEHPCTICRDLLAAPVIVGCSHTFCGSCIIEYRNACESEDADVVHCCPVCREEIDHEPTYEMILDKDLERLVELVPACPLKAEWKQRRAEYLRYRRNRLSGKGTGSNGADDEEIDPYWRAVIDWAVPVLAFAAIALMMTVRRMF